MSTESRASFFRQSGWLVIATFVSGVAMWAVHLFSKHPALASGEYGVFTTMLQLLYWMMIPGIGVGLVRAAGCRRDGWLVANFPAGAVRTVTGAMFALWLLACGALAQRKRR